MRGSASRRDGALGPGGKGPRAATGGTVAAGLGCFEHGPGRGLRPLERLGRSQRQRQTLCLRAGRHSPGRSAGSVRRGAPAVFRPAAGAASPGPRKTSGGRNSKASRNRPTPTTPKPSTVSIGNWHDPRNRLLRSEHVQHIMQARYDLYLRKLKGKHDEEVLFQIQREIAAVDPSTFWGIRRHGLSRHVPPHGQSVPRVRLGGRTAVEGRAQSLDAQRYGVFLRPCRLLSPDDSLARRRR